MSKPSGTVLAEMSLVGGSLWLAWAASRCSGRRAHHHATSHGMLDAENAYYLQLGVDEKGPAATRREISSGIGRPRAWSSTGRAPSTCSSGLCAPCGRHAYNYTRTARRRQSRPLLARLGEHFVSLARLGFCDGVFGRVSRTHVALSSRCQSRTGWDYTWRLSHLQPP